MIRRLSLLAALLLALGGCGGGGGAAPTPPPPAALPVYYYVGSPELNLKSQPGPASSDRGVVRLNDRVEMVQRQGSWFLVQTGGGQQGWASEEHLRLSPVTGLYVRRWGVNLRTSPDEQAKSVARLRPNDRVTLQETNQQGWARVSVSRTGSSGWLQMSDLSTAPVAVRRRVRRPAQPAPTAAPAASPSQTPAPVPAAPASLAPAPAQAAPPPQEKSTTPPKPRREVSPTRFEPF